MPLLLWTRGEHQLVRLTFSRQKGWSSYTKEFVKIAKVFTLRINPACYYYYHYYFFGIRLLSIALFSSLTCNGHLKDTIENIGNYLSCVLMNGAD